MPELSPEKLKTYRSRTFCLAPGTRVASPAEALDFVNERGFVFFWPIKGVDLPSLWVAHAGDRPVADEHDDPGHTTWGWKDDALGKRIWYYAKVLRRKATMIALPVAPYFYALSENFGSPEEDHLIMYEEGRLTLAAKNIYESLLREGPLHTLELRKAARLTSAGSEPEFNRALEQLKTDFKILPIGVAPAGAWKYAFIYQVVARHYPDLADQARAIGEAEARAKLAGLYLRSVGAAQLRDVTRLFGWPPELAKRTLARLVQAGELADGVTRADRPGEWLALKELVSTDL
jgi:hypothetical protein